MKSISALAMVSGVRRGIFAGVLAVMFALGVGAPASALLPTPGPSSGSIGVEGKIPTAPPKTGATIVSPANGQSFSSTPITVSGFCPSGLLVKIYDNGIFVGSTICQNSSYSIKITVFNGSNELEAHVFDALDQEGPVSNKVTVTFNDAQFAQFGSHVSVTSPYARRGAEPNQQLTWPIVISGGNGPYAVSVDWGDGTPAELQSIAFAGNVTLEHTYKSSGTYSVLITAVDANRTQGFLQVVAVISGNTSGQQGKADGGSTAVTNPPADSISITVLVLCLVLIIIMGPVSFWLGRRYELSTLREQIERERREA